MKGFLIILGPPRVVFDELKSTLRNLMYFSSILSVIGQYNHGPENHHRVLQQEREILGAILEFFPSHSFKNGYFCCMC
jgi:hypothetical protein